MKYSPGKSIHPLKVREYLQNNSTVFVARPIGFAMMPCRLVSKFKRGFVAFEAVEVVKEKDIITKILHKC